MNGKDTLAVKKQESKRKRKTKNHIPGSCIVVASKLMISILFLLRERVCPILILCCFSSYILFKCVAIPLTILPYPLLYTCAEIIVVFIHIIYIYKDKEI